MKHEDIAQIAQEIQRITTYTDHITDYSIHAAENHHIRLNVQPENKEYVARYGPWAVLHIPSAYVHDIHAILRIVHPDLRYNLRQDVYCTNINANIYVPHHPTRPNILSYTDQTHHHPGKYILHYPTLPDIVIGENETLYNATQRILQSFCAHHPCQHLPADPYISYEQCNIGHDTPIPAYPHIYQHINISNLFPSSDIIVSIKLYTYANIPDQPNILMNIFATTLTISPHAIHDITPAYRESIQKIDTNIIDHIQQHPRIKHYSQHEKSQILRHILDYVAPENAPMLRNILQCMQAFTQYYVYIPPQHKATIS